MNKPTPEVEFSLEKAHTCKCGRVSYHYVGTSTWTCLSCGRMWNCASVYRVLACKSCLKGKKKAA